MIAWQPSASMECLRERAQSLADIRDFFNSRGYLEVETPVMARFGVTDVYLQNIVATFRGQEYALQTSPEYHMKRLLAAGSGPIFQVARVFRDDELGRWHNPEFTLLEWYQLNVDHLTLLEEVDVLLQRVLHCDALQIITYQNAFIEACELDPFDAQLSTLKESLARFDLDNVLPADETCRDQYLFLLMSHVVEPSFASSTVPIAVIDFPATQASLAQIEQGVASRFEVYYKGVELANGFHELIDPDAQALRFNADCHARRLKDLPESLPDEFLLAALRHGLPACSGVALGFDRLFALAKGETSLSKILSFDFSRS